MNKIDTLIKENTQMIAHLEFDSYIDASKMKSLLRENRRFLVRCHKLFLSDTTTTYCKCKGGAKGRTVTEDFEHQICEQCGNISK